MLRFADPWLLVALAAVPVLAALDRRDARQARGQGLRVSSLSGWRAVASPWPARARRALGAAKLGAIALAAVALARPQAGTVINEVRAEGIDIMIALDISGSMAAEDFQPLNRLAVAKGVIERFVEGRAGDRIGLVVFAARAITKCPLIVDPEILKGIVEEVEMGEIEDGTAIGTAIATAAARMKDLPSKARVMVLATDGMNNRGEIAPAKAAEIAAALGIRIYTVAVGTTGIVPMPVKDETGRWRRVMARVEMDEELLSGIAAATGGKHFRATDPEALESAFAEIDGLEKSEAQVSRRARYRELFPFFLWPAVGLVVLDAVLVRTRLRRVP